MSVVRNIAYLLLLLLLLVLVVVFSAVNPGPITLDLAFTTVELQKSLAMTLVFGAGWVFGLLCAAIVLLKTLGERRRLRRSLRLAEEEVRALRSLPIQDAD